MASGNSRRSLDYAERFCHQLYKKDCPPMTPAQLRSLYILLKDEFPASDWPPFETLMEAVTSSLPQSGRAALICDQYLCAACSHVFGTERAFLRHLSASEHIKEAQKWCERTFNIEEHQPAAGLKCPLEGCHEKFDCIKKLSKHVCQDRHLLFFVAKTFGLGEHVNYACTSCGELFPSKCLLSDHRLTCIDHRLQGDDKKDIEMTFRSTARKVIATSTGVDVSEYRSKGQVKLTCRIRNNGKSDLTILKAIITPTPPTFALASDHHNGSGEFRTAALESEKTYDLHLIASALDWYGFHVGSLHIIFEKQSSGVAVVLEWAVCLEITSNEHELLAPSAPYVKRPTEPWIKAPVMPGVKPRSESHDMLEHRLPLHAYLIPEELRALSKSRTAPGIETKLSKECYREKMSTLLHVEELAMEEALQGCTLKAVTMKTDKVYFFLQVPALIDKSQEINIGEKVRAIPMTAQLKPDTSMSYIGYVHDITGTTLKLRFPERFFSRYVNGMKFIVEFPLHRHNLKLFHRAIEMATSNKMLMDKVLFPTAEPHLDQNVAVTATESIRRSMRIKDKSIETNPEQLQAVAAIAAGASLPHPFLIFGPPGTGKTTTVVEAIKQVHFLHKKSRVLVCTPQNNAADLVTLRLLKHIPEGQLIRLNAASRKITQVLDAKVKKVSNYTKSGKIFFPASGELFHKRIIVCTLATSARLVAADLGREFFTHVFVDESGQAPEPEALIPISGLIHVGQPGETCVQLVLAGDPKQLGPVLQSRVAKMNGLGLSLLERLMTDCDMYQKRSEGLSYDPNFVVKLVRNFRSHPAILTICNRLFYDGELQACADIADRERFCSWAELPVKGFPVIMHGVFGRDSREGSNPSFFNVAEAETVADYVLKLLTMSSPRVLPGDVGIISPYKQQVNKILRLLNAKFKNNTPAVPLSDIKAGTAEVFQGQEKPVIIISTVRTEKNLGFVGDPKRFNVAITRAKSLLIVVGNPKILSQDSSWRSFIQYCQENGAIRSAHSGF